MAQKLLSGNCAYWTAKKEPRKGMFIALVKQCSTINNVETIETKLNVP